MTILSICPIPFRSGTPVCPCLTGRLSLPRFKPWQVTGRPSRRRFGSRLKKLRELAEAIPNGPAAEFTYFKPDSKKDGGAYITVTGAVKKVDSLERLVWLDHGEAIPIEAIVKIQDKHDS